MKHLIATMAIIAVGGVVTAQPQPKAAVQTPEAMKASIEALRSSDVAWRKIAWKSCLLDGIKASRELKKPMILWIFIDRPVDDQRC